MNLRPNSDIVIEAAQKGAASILLSDDHHIKDVGAIVIQKYNSFPHPEISDPGAWAYTVGRNEALKIARHESRYQYGLPLDTSAFDLPLLNRSDAVDFITAVQNSLNRIVLSLDEHEQRLFNVVWGSVSHDPDIKDSSSERLRSLANELGVLPDSVRKQWDRLLEKIALQLINELNHDPVYNELIEGVLDSDSGLKWLKQLVRALPELISIIRHVLE